MTAIAAMIVKEWKTLLRDPGGLILLFILPAVFILVFSLALQGVFSGSTRERMEVLVVDEDGGDVCGKIIEVLGETGHFRPVSRIDSGPVTRQRARSEIAAGRYSAAIIIPPGATGAARLETDATIEVLADPVIPEAIVGGITSAVQASVHLLAIETLEGTIDDLSTTLDEMEGTVEELSTAVEELDGAVIDLHSELEKASKLMPPFMRSSIGVKDMDEQGRILEKKVQEHRALIEANTRRPGERERMAGLAVEQRYTSAADEQVRPDSVQQNVPGWTIFALFWIVQTLGLNIIAERTSGAYKRILVAPVSRAAYIVGKAIPFLAINVVQAVFLFSMGVWILPLLGAPRLDIPDIPAVALLTLATSLTAICLGLLMSTLSRSAFLMASVTAALLIVMTVLAGIMVPRFVMPAFMQKMSLIVPQGWALEGFHDVLVRGHSTVQILPVTGVLLAFGAAFFVAALVGLSRMDRTR